MNKKRTLDEVIIEVLEKAQESLRVEEIYRRIMEDGLYDFKSDTPVHIVRTALRRKSTNLELKNSKNNRFYIYLPDGTYNLKKYEPFLRKGTQLSKRLTKQDFRRSELIDAHKNYTNAFKENLLAQLKTMDPIDFEIFCKNFLKAYGFRKLENTRSSKDGGLDGYGELKVGLSWMPVAFECKRYSEGKIGRPKIDQFRGSVQGDYPYGIFFTTSSFTKEARETTFKPGATPVVLVDGKGIVDLMIERNFGVEKEDLPLFRNSMDLVIDKQ